MLKNKRGLLIDFKEKVTEAIDFLKNDSGKIVKVNSNSSYKYDGEFLIKEYTRNLKAKK